MIVSANKRTKLYRVVGGCGHGSAVAAGLEGRQKGHTVRRLIMAKPSAASPYAPSAEFLSMRENKRTKLYRAAALGGAVSRHPRPLGEEGGSGGGRSGPPPMRTRAPPEAQKREGERARTHKIPRDGEILILVPLFDESPKR